MYPINDFCLENLSKTTSKTCYLLLAIGFVNPELIIFPDISSCFLLVPAAKRGTSLGLPRVFLICVEVFSHLM